MKNIQQLKLGVAGLFSRGVLALPAVGLVLSLGMLVPGGSATASTPDGETPANEGVCDPLHGGTPGLYGLCVAYCEAQDLDSFDKEPPRTKILENYDKKKQAGDPDMPCIQVPCPCWSDEEIASITADGMVAACPASTNKLQVIDNTALTKFAEADTNAGRERCRYIDLNTAPRTIRSFSIPPEEAQACYAAVVDACSVL
jgi:hypothetical protein